MLVRDSLDACTCDECGIVCGGKFANCWRSVFQPNGRALQIRCLPHDLVTQLEQPAPAVAQAPSAAEIQASQALTIETAQVVEAQVDQEAPAAESGAGARVANEQPAGTPDHSQLLETGSVVDTDRISIAVESTEREIAMLREELASLVGRIQRLDSTNINLRDELARLSAAIESFVRPIAPVNASGGGMHAEWTRPARAVAHPESLPTASETGPIVDVDAEGSSRATRAI